MGDIGGHGPVMHVELVEDVRYVPGSRGRADSELLGDRAVWEPISDELEHLHLTARERPMGSWAFPAAALVAGVGESSSQMRRSAAPMLLPLRSSGSGTTLAPGKASPTVPTRS